jgi:bromodomain-containing factor 1
MNKSLEVSTSHNFTSNTVGINGDANMDAFSSNQKVDAPPVDPVESQQTEPSTTMENTNSMDLLDSLTTNTDVDQTANSPKDNLPALPLASNIIYPLSEPGSAIDSAIESAVNDTTANSSIPPIVEAQESDIRDSTPPPAVASDATADTQVAEQSLSLDLGGESEVFPESDSLTESADLPTHTSDLPPLPIDVKSPQPPAYLEANTTTNADMEQAIFTSPTTQTQDIEMVDAPVAASKVSREREDDTEMEPSAKRTKTEDETAEHPAPEAQQVSQNGEADGARPITPYEGKEIIKILKNSSRTKGGKNFRDSVRVLWPGFADDYEAKIHNQVHLLSLENKIRKSEYPSMDAFKAEVNLLYENAALFNGVTHNITAAAKECRDSILQKVATIPAEPAAVPKAPKNKPSRSTPVAEVPPRASAARRPSRSAGTAPAPHIAPVPAPAPTFALDPTTNTPLIRRDSTVGGRPKREIHPPKNRDLAYAARPKSKKFATELKFCDDVLNEMKKGKYISFTGPFLSPVDPVALGIPQYFALIKNPMDVSTVAKKLASGDYTRAKDFETDMRLIVANCYKFNPSGNPVREMGRQFEELFNSQWAKKDQYIQDHNPAAISPSESAGDDDEESEEEEEEVQAPAGNSAATLRLIEEQNKLITLMASKKTDPGIITMQQEMVDFLKKKVDEENARAPAVKKSVKKAKATKATKKAAPVRKATGGGANKKAGNARGGRYMGTLEKEVISAGLGDLPDTVSGGVLEMIKNDQPGVDVSQCR